MKKYFHELTKEEFKKLQKEDLTWEQCAKDYPQPTWCAYPEAVSGVLGCWSLMDFNIHSEKDCLNCECLATPKEE